MPSSVSVLQDIQILDKSTDYIFDGIRSYYETGFVTLIGHGLAAKQILSSDLQFAESLLSLDRKAAANPGVYAGCRHADGTLDVQKTLVVDLAYKVYSWNRLVAKGSMAGKYLVSLPKVAALLSNGMYSRSVAAGSFIAGRYDLAREFGGRAVQCLSEINKLNMVQGLIIKVQNRWREKVKEGRRVSFRSVLLDYLQEELNKGGSDVVKGLLDGAAEIEEGTVRELFQKFLSFAHTTLSALSLGAYGLAAFETRKANPFMSEIQLITAYSGIMDKAKQWAKDNGLETLSDAETVKGYIIDVGGKRHVLESVSDGKIVEAETIQQAGEQLLAVMIDGARNLMHALGSLELGDYERAAVYIARGTKAAAMYQNVIKLSGYTDKMVGKAVELLVIAHEIIDKDLADKKVLEEILEKYGITREEALALQKIAKGTLEDQRAELLASLKGKGTKVLSPELTRLLGIAYKKMLSSDAESASMLLQDLGFEGVSAKQLAVFVARAAKLMVQAINAYLAGDFVKAQRLNEQAAIWSDAFDVASRMADFSRYVEKVSEQKMLTYFEAFLKVTDEMASDMNLLSSLGFDGGIFRDLIAKGCSDYETGLKALASGNMDIASEYLGRASTAFGLVKTAMSLRSITNAARLQFGASVQGKPKAARLEKARADHAEVIKSGNEKEIIASLASLNEIEAAFEKAFKEWFRSHQDEVFSENGYMATEYMKFLKESGQLEGASKIVYGHRFMDMAADAVSNLKQGIEAYLTGRDARAQGHAARASMVNSVAKLIADAVRRFLKADADGLFKGGVYAGGTASRKKIKAAVLGDYYRYLQRSFQIRKQGDAKRFVTSDVVSLALRVTTLFVHCYEDLSVHPWTGLCGVYKFLIFLRVFRDLRGYYFIGIGYRICK